MLKLDSLPETTPATILASALPLALPFGSCFLLVFWKRMSSEREQSRRNSPTRFPLITDDPFPHPALMPSFLSPFTRWFMTLRDWLLPLHPGSLMRSVSLAFLC